MHLRLGCLLELLESDFTVEQAVKEAQRRNPASLYPLSAWPQERISRTSIQTIIPIISMQPAPAISPRISTPASAAPAPTAIKPAQIARWMPCPCIRPNLDTYGQ